ncbi:MAG: LysM peptidoglycan-binding domain-containing protein [Oceanospirillaceae bacterium]|nr:LysM peptidoglycan-binding domain-containing protein [Oceanospirillaceae bacterium]
MLHRIIALTLLLAGITGCATTSHPQQTASIADKPSINNPIPDLLVDEMPQDSDLLAEVERTAAEADRASATYDDQAIREDIWDRIRDNFAMDLDQNNSRIDAQLRWFASHQAYMDRVTERAERYMHFIMEHIETRDIPGEIALLPIVESAFDPFAYSHGRASGVWQFIPSTGRLYGLKQDWWYDGRRDIRLATVAALRYLSALAREFDGDWMLALASYNSGAGTVRRAIRQNREKGLPTDYWSLNLPKETQDYVPKLLALSKIIANPKQYGITLTPIVNEPYFAVVDTGSQIDLSQAAELAEVDIEEIYKLNPAFNQWATSPDGPHQILIPADKSDIFAANLAQMPASQRIKWQRYKVKSGDNLISIARAFHTTPDALKQVNPLTGNNIRSGETLLIPTAVKNPEQYSLSASNRLTQKQSNQSVPGSTRVEHIVSAGDSFWELSRNHKVPVRSIAKWNGMAPGDPLVPGQKLVIWSKADSKKSKLTYKNREVIRKVTYKVRSGDSLFKIADKFNVRVSDIRKWNRMTKKKYLKPGETLVLYVDVTQTG